MFSHLGDLKIIEPPSAITSFQYRCAATFWKDPLTYSPTPEVHLVLINQRQCDLAILRDGRIEMIDTLESHCGGKHGQGGQSQQRFERLFHEKVFRMYSKAAEVVNHLPIVRLLVGGSGIGKKHFIEKVHPTLQTKLLGIFEVGYEGYSGMRELLTKAQEVLTSLQYGQDKRQYDRFFERIMKDDHAIYGESAVLRAIQQGQVDTLLLTRRRWQQLQPLWDPLCQQTHVQVQCFETAAEEVEMFDRTFGVGAVLRYGD